MMKITVVQTSPKILKRDQNLNQIEGFIKSIKSDLVIFPELANSGYHLKNKKELNRVSESAQNGPTSKLLRYWSRKKNMAIVCGFAEKSNSRYFNSAFFITPRSTYVYRKIHLFNTEKRIFSPGNRPLKVYKWKNMKVGVMICFDWFFPEVSQSLARKGAHLIAHPSNLVLPYAPRGMQVRSLENKVFSVTANRIGSERGLKFRGQSQILDVEGKILKQIPKNRVGHVSALINIKQAEQKMFTKRNHIFKDRNKKLYR